MCVAKKKKPVFIHLGILRCVLMLFFSLLLPNEGPGVLQLNHGNRPEERTYTDLFISPLLFESDPHTSVHSSCIKGVSL